MELKVVNALSRDVEREQLNKILKYISDSLHTSTESGITEAQVKKLIAESMPTIPAKSPITINVTGDVEGSGTGTTSIAIPVELTKDFVEDAPIDSGRYWRYQGGWETVPFPLLSLAYMSPSGFGAYNEDDLEWNSRELQGTAGNITVTNGDGLAGDPVFDLSPVADSGTGTLLAITRDGFGRVTGTKAATITGTSGQINVSNGTAASGLPTISLADVADTGTGTLQKTQFDSKGRKTGTASATTTDLPEGTNLYYTDARADARAAAAVSSHVAQPDPHPQYVTPAEAAAAAPVQSVNGKTGVVSLAPADVGLASGTTGQFWRGDGVWSNELTAGPIVAAPVAALTFRITQPAFNNMPMGQWDIFGTHDGSDYSAAVTITPRAAAAWSASEKGTLIQFRTIRLGAASLSEHCRFGGAGEIAPGADNSQSVGTADRRWSTVYAGTGTINTSDAREKTEVQKLTTSELEAAIVLGKEIGSYKWLAMVSEKGDSARDHIGMTVQRAIEVMEQHNLDPYAYGFICYDSWESLEEIRDEDGSVLQEARPAGDRYSFRMDELAMFILAGQNHRLEMLEERLNKM